MNETTSVTSYLRMIDKIFKDAEDSAEISDHIRELKLWFIDSSVGYFDVIGGQVYIRPSSLYDITGHSFHEEAKRQAGALSSTPIYNRGLTLPDYHISGFGLLIFSQIISLDYDTTQTLITAYTEKGEAVRRSAKMIGKSLSELQAEKWMGYIEKLSNMLKTFRNTPADILTPEEKNFFAVMNYAFADYLPPTNEEYKLVKFLPRNNNMPALTWEYLCEYVKESNRKSKEDIWTRLENSDANNSGQFWSKFGSTAYSAIKQKDEITPKILATLRYTGLMSEWAYIMAISDIKRLYHHRPAGGLGVKNCIY